MSTHFSEIFCWEFLFHLILLWTWNFRLNGLHFGNSTIFHDFLETFSGNRYAIAPIIKVLEVLVEWKAFSWMGFSHIYCTVGQLACRAVTIRFFSLVGLLPAYWWAQMRLIICIFVLHYVLQCSCRPALPTFSLRVSIECPSLSDVPFSILDGLLVDHKINFIFLCH